MHDALHMPVDLVSEATEFATRAHGDQVRKYSGTPYITHPLAVADIVKSVPHTTEMIVAAILHDVVEDTDVSLETIQEKFGDVVAELVYYLTDISQPEDGNRATRKEKDALHYAQGSAQAQTIKVADLIHNSKDIAQNDPGFWKVYKVEKLRILDLLTKADQTLVKFARNQIENQ